MIFTFLQNILCRAIKINFIIICLNGPSLGPNCLSPIAALNKLLVLLVLLMKDQLSRLNLLAEDEFKTSRTEFGFFNSFLCLCYVDLCCSSVGDVDSVFHVFKANSVSLLILF